MMGVVAASDPGWVFMVFFPFVFVGFWCLVCFIIAFLGGWWDLAKAFPSRRDPRGLKFPMVSASFGLAGYNNCLTMHACEEGVDLAVWPFFRIGHPPIFLPWSELRRVSPRKFLWMKWVAIDLGSPKIASIRISERLYDSLKVEDTENTAGSPKQDR